MSIFRKQLGDATPRSDGQVLRALAEAIEALLTTTAASFTREGAIADAVEALLITARENTNTIAKAMAANTDERNDAAEWRAAVLRGENDELIDIVETCLVFMRSSGKALNAHHNPQPLEGARALQCNICERFNIETRAAEIFTRLKAVNERAKARARTTINLEAEV